MDNLICNNCVGEINKETSKEVTFANGDGWLCFNCYLELNDYFGIMDDIKAEEQEKEDSEID